jgi:hypothetical protein
MERPARACSQESTRIYVSIKQEICSSGAIKTILRGAGCSSEIEVEWMPFLEDERWVSSALEGSNFFVRHLTILAINEDIGSCYRFAIDYRKWEREVDGWMRWGWKWNSGASLRLHCAESGYRTAAPFFDVAVESRLWRGESSIVNMLDMICFIVKETGIYGWKLS